MCTLCGLFGMVISDTKSPFLEHGIDERTMEKIELLLPYRVYPLVYGTKYLGYFINPNNYLAIDWQCVIPFSLALDMLLLF